MGGGRGGAILMHSKLGKGTDSMVDEPLMNLMRMIYSIEEYEFQYLTHLKRSLPIGKDWSPPLIDVWKHYDTFFLEVNMIFPHQRN